VAVGIEIEDERLVLVPDTSDEEKQLRALVALRCSVVIDRGAG
jgi:hypothetical protein